MTRQYIGARYVPIIDGEYNSEKVYEPLTIVTYNGSSYTSKKSVPAGTLPTNTEYWAMTGNYNAQVEEYRQETQDATTRVAALELLKAYTTPQAFGARGDGVTDDTEAINAAIDYASTNHVPVVISGGVFKVSFSADTLDNQHYAILLKSDVTVIVSDATITSDANDLTHYSYFECNTVNNVRLIGFNAAILGERDTHIGNTGEWGYGVHVIKSNNVEVSGFTINKCWGDAIAVDNVNSNVTIRDIIATKNGRNGISVTGGEHIIIENCVITETDRTLPKAGIDLEPFDAYTINDVVVRDCDVRGNDTYGVLIGSSAVDNVVIENVTADKLTRSVVNSGKVTYRNCNFYDLLIGSIDCIVDGCSITDRLYFEGIAGNCTIKECMFDGSRLDTHNNTGNIRVVGCTFLGDTDDVNFFGNESTYVDSCRFEGISTHYRVSNVRELVNSYVKGNIANIHYVSNNYILGMFHNAYSDVVISGNYFSSESYSDFYDTSNVVITGNRFNTNSYGIRFMGTGSNIAINANMFTAITNLAYAVAFPAESSYNRVRGAYNSTDKTFYLGGASDYYIVSDTGVVQQS